MDRADVSAPQDMRFDYTLHPGAFKERPNRFISVIDLLTETGTEEIRAHVPDPGRLKELLIPGVSVLVRDHGDNPTRKLRYSLEMVFSDSGQWVSLNTQLPNRLVGWLLSNRALPGFEAYTLTKREVTMGSSRIDFLLENPQGQKAFMEIKSCTLVEPGENGERLALFPDAPSERGTRHIEELTHLQQSGTEARILFIIQRSDATRFAANRRTDPKLAHALAQAFQAGVCIQAYCFEISPHGCRFIKEVPVVYL